MMQRATVLLVILSALGFACGRGDSDVSQAELEHARELVRLGRFEEAVAPLTRLHRADPTDYEISHLYGLALLQTDNAGMAIWPLRTAAQHPGHEVEDGLLLARALSTSAVPMDALRVVDELLERSPNDIALWSLRAKVNQSLRFDEEALSDCEVMLELDENRADAMLCQIDSLTKLGRGGEAESLVLEGLRRLDESKSAAPVMKARFCQKSAELAEALHPVDEAADRWLDCAETHPQAVELVKRAVAFLDANDRADVATQLMKSALTKGGAEFALVEALSLRYEAASQDALAREVLERATRTRGIARAAWIALADFHRRRDEFDMAIAAMEKGLADREELPALLVAQYADDLVQARRFEVAESVIEELPDHPMVPFLRGRMQLLQGDSESALATLAKGLELWPDNPTARFLAGEAALQLGDVDRAIREYRDSLRAGAGFTEAPLRLAKLHEAEGNLSAALIALAHRSKDIPDDIETRRALLRVARRAGRADVAQEQIDALATLPDASAVLAVESARNTASFVGTAAAIDEIRASGADLSDPRNVELLETLVELLVVADEGDEALEIADRARRANPDDPAYWESQASALIASDRSRDEARDALSRAIALEPTRSSALRGLALLSADPVVAIELLDRAQANNSEDQRDAWQAVLRLIESGGDEFEISSRLESILRLDPTHGPAAAGLAERVAKNPDGQERAIELADRAMRFGGGPPAFLLRARLATRTGDLTAARRILRRLDSARPADPTVRLGLAEGYLEAGDERRAAAILRSLQETDDRALANSARDLLAQLERNDEG